MESKIRSNSKKVSIVITTYNSAAFIRKAVEPLLRQMSDEDEIIIVDDGSKDDTPQLITQINDSRIKYFWQQNSGSPAGPRNRGVEAAKGEYVFIFDSDDAPLPEKISASVQALDDNPSADFLFTNFDMVDEFGKLLIHGYVDQYDSLSDLLTNNLSDHLYYLEGRTLFTHLFKAKFIGTSSVVFRRSAWNQTTGFDESFSNLDDRDMWLQLAQNGDALFLDLCLHQYRDHDAGISKQETQKQIKERIRLGEKYCKSALNRIQRTQIRKYTARNYLQLGYENFHQQENKFSALTAFLSSFFLKPCLPAFKGIVKSIIPRFVYNLIR